MYALFKLITKKIVEYFKIHDNFFIVLNCLTILYYQNIPSMQYCKNKKQCENDPEI